MIELNPPERIYFDQAATTWPKLPEAVQAAVEFINHCGATSGRGAYASARSADRWLSQARHNLAQLVGTDGGDQIAFCSSGTHALNALLLGLIQPGDRVVTTAIEHNSVLRPLEQLRIRETIELSIVPCDVNGRVDLQMAEKMLDQPTRMVVISHASNVTGCLQDIGKWSELTQRANALLIVDVSQTLGYMPISMDQLGIDALATAGHKGLGALAGTGFIAASSRVQSQLQPLMFGGTGTASERMDFTPSWPQTVEVGNLNMPAIASMAAAAAVWLRHSKATPQQEQLSKHPNAQRAMLAWQPAFARFLAGLRRLADTGVLRLVGHIASPTPAEIDSTGSRASQPTDDAWLPIVSIVADGWDIHELAAVLDGNFGIEARAGYHCAALIHSFLNTQATGGTLRFSLGHKTTFEEVDQVLEALTAIVQT